jgi:hypothetical protein
LVAEVGGLCGWCRKAVKRLQFHHLDGDRARTVPENMIAICGTCHDCASLGNPSPADLDLRKKMLAWERQTKSYHAPAAAPVPTQVLNVTGTVSGGSVANEIHEHHYHGTKSAKRLATPGTIEANPVMQTYVQYLREKYIWCRLQGPQYGDTKPFHPAQTNSVFQKALGYAAQKAPEKAFPHVVETLTKLVRGTVYARKIGYSPHSYAEHCRRQGEVQ